MNVRPATDADRADIETTVRRSLRASYALSPQEIETVLEAEFGPDELAGRIDGDGDHLFVVTGSSIERDDVDAVGFAELADDGTLRWVHVHPDAREQGFGTALVERVQDEQSSQSAPFTARMLESTNDGGRFLERFGLDRVESRTREFGSQRLDVTLFAREGQAQDPTEPTVDVGDETVVDGDLVSVRRDSGLAGTQAPFYPLGEDEEQPVGFVCAQCGSADVTGDGLDRLECNDCGNSHRPDDWDSAYL